LRAHGQHGKAASRHLDREMFLIRELHEETSWIFLGQEDQYARFEGNGTISGN
jgi:hypothetical protein